MTETDRYGTLNETAEGWELHFERHLDRPPAVAWQAFVDPELLAVWFPTSIEGNLVEGETLRFVIKAMEADPFEGVVIEVDEPHRLAFMWGPDLLRFELEPSGAGTRLTLHVLVEARGKAARDGAGWHECLDQLVEALAEGEVPTPATWSEVHPTYVQRFGPEAATIGPPEGHPAAQA